MALSLPHTDDLSTSADAAHLTFWKLTVAYDGTDFYGWQVQPGLPTVQGALADAIRTITHETVLPQGSGRTDTGVHAAGQVVSFALRAPIPADRLQRALNRRLPSSIRVIDTQIALKGFHARANVVEKAYEYRIFESFGDERVCSPLMARFVWDCPTRLDVKAMQSSAAAVIGTHDFTSFAASDPDLAEREGGTPRSACRTIFAADWLHDGGLLVFRVTGSGFLHHMVRNLVGTCVEAGAGRRRADGIAVLIAARDRRLAGPTAPPQGLHLMRVVYGEGAA